MLQAQYALSIDFQDNRYSYLYLELYQYFVLPILEPYDAQQNSNI